ncbi:MAG: multiheme c-type cytochrome [Candidatus Brocadiaceae bacterium]
MRIYFSLFIILLTIIFSFAVHASPKNIGIVFSGEELGNIDPCGCYDGQIGGLPRRYSFIDSLRKQKNIILPVSLGDLPRSFGRQDEIKTEIFCRALGEMDYVLHNLGEKDIELGLQSISYLSQTSKVVFLSSNIEISPAFPVKICKYVLKDCNDVEYPLKIAFLGILSQALVNSNTLDCVHVYEPVEALKILIKEVQHKADLIILLSHASLSESIKIAKSFPEIGLIITGHNIDEPKDAVIYVKNTPIVSSGTDGRFLGCIKYSINKNRVIKRTSVEILPLDNRYKDSEEMVSLLKEYQQMLIDEDLLSRIQQTPLAEELSYVGSPTCGMCHKMIYDHWLKTAHASAYYTLVKAGHQYDPECIKCHTIGYGFVSGFLNFEKDRNLINVGCESCHGAGSGHIKNVNSLYGESGENNCKICHDHDHSPKFQYKDYWVKIIHPRETMKNLSEVTR